MNYRTLSNLLAALLVLLLTGCAATTPVVPADAPPAAAQAAPEKKNVPQDPALRITTEEVMALFAKEFGDAPLIKETLDKKQSFLLVDTRPAVRFNEGTVPGSIHIPTPKFESDIPKLPKDRLIIFYCGGLA